MKKPTKTPRKFLWSLLLFCFLFSTILQAQNFSYPVQEFRLGIGNTNRNVILSGTAEGDYLTSYTTTGERTEKWYLNYIQAGVYEIVNSQTGMVLTNANGLAVQATNTNASSQRWNIVAVEQDFEGYDLYYKITSNANSTNALTFDPNTNGFTVSTYSGTLNQKFKLNLDGLEGYGANAQVSGQEKAGTIGGLLGPTEFVTTKEELVAALDKTGPRTVVVNGNIDMVNQDKTKQRIRDHKTLVGSYSANTIYDCQLRNDDFYGADPAPSNNIVVRNVNFVARSLNSTGSGVIHIQIYGGRNIWIDHNSFSATFAQNRDVEVGKFLWINTPSTTWSDGVYNGINPDYITISYNTFTNRYWTVAYGSQNTDKSRLRTTMMFNRWEQCSRRTPQVSNGFHHNYSSFHTVTGSSNPNASSQIIAGEGSRVLSEANRFEALKGLETSIDRNNALSFHDIGSYTASTTSATPSTLSITSLGSAWSAKDSYGYHLVSGYQSSGKDTKGFNNLYAGSFNSYAGIKYITDAALSEYISTRYESPFLQSIEVGSEPLGPWKEAALLDTSHTYSLQNLNSGLYLSLEGSVVQNGSNAIQGAEKQKWTLHEAGDGFYQVQPQIEESSIYYLDVDSGKTANGTKIGLWTNTASDAQLFKFVLNENGSYQLTTKVSRDQSCIGVAAASSAPGASAVEWECNGSTDQSWILNIEIPLLQGTYFKDLQIFDTENYKDWEVAPNLQIGDLVFGDRSVTFSEIPSELLGSEMIRTAADSKTWGTEEAQFITTQDLTLSVAMDARVQPLPAWLNQWSATGSTLKNSTDVVFELYQKEFAAGDTVVLGTNGQSSGCVNYVVLLQPSAITKSHLVEAASPALHIISQGKNGSFLEIDGALNAQISLMDTRGKQIREFKLTKGSRQKIPLGPELQGLFLIRIQSTAGIHTKQVFLK